MISKDSFLRQIENLNYDSEIYKKLFREQWFLEISKHLSASEIIKVAGQIMVDKQTIVGYMLSSCYFIATTKRFIVYKKEFLTGIKVLSISFNQVTSFEINETWHRSHRTCIIQSVNGKMSFTFYPTISSLSIDKGCEYLDNVGYVMNNLMFI